MNHPIASTLTALAILASLMVGQDTTPPAASNPAALPAVSDVTPPAVRRITLRVETKIAAPENAEAHRLELWVAAPRIDPNQSMIDVATSDVKGGVLERRTESEQGNTFLHLAVEDPREAVEFVASWTLDRREIVSGRFRRSAPRALTTEESSALARELGPNEKVPVVGRLKTRAEALAKGEKDPINLARAIYDDVLRTMEYKKTGTGWGQGDSLWACDAGYGNCTDFHSLFLSMARARGIPARFLMGLPLPAQRTSEDKEIPGYHCWGEFYVPDSGWIPVDISEARKNPSLVQYYFGNLTEDRIAFTSGRDIQLAPPSKAERHNFFIHPYAELDGKPVPVAVKYVFRDA